MTAKLYTQREVDDIVTAARREITGDDKLYTQAELDEILAAVRANPVHREKPHNQEVINAS